MPCCARLALAGIPWQIIIQEQPWPVPIYLPFVLPSEELGVLTVAICALLASALGGVLFRRPIAIVAFGAIAGYLVGGLILLVTHGPHGSPVGGYSMLLHLGASFAIPAAVAAGFQVMRRNKPGGKPRSAVIGNRP